MERNVISFSSLGKLANAVPSLLGAVDSLLAAGSSVTSVTGEPAALFDEMKTAARRLRQDTEVYVQRARGCLHAVEQHIVWRQTIELGREGESAVEMAYQENDPESDGAAWSAMVTLETERERMFVAFLNGRDSVTRAVLPAFSSLLGKVEEMLREHDTVRQSVREIVSASVSPSDRTYVEARLNYESMRASVLRSLDATQLLLALAPTLDFGQAAVEYDASVREAIASCDVQIPVPESFEEAWSAVQSNVAKV